MHELNGLGGDLVVCSRELKGEIFEDMRPRSWNPAPPFLVIMASCRCLKQSSLPSLNLVDLGFLSLEYEEEKSFLIDLELSLSSLAREIR